MGFNIIVTCIIKLIVYCVNRMILCKTVKKIHNQNIGRYLIYYIGIPCFGFKKN